MGQFLTIRNASDYDDMFLASRDETEEQIINAEYVYKLISEYISEIDNASGNIP